MGQKRFLHCAKSVLSVQVSAEGENISLRGDLASGGVHYLRKISDGFNFGQKKCPKIKPSEIFKCPKF